MPTIILAKGLPEGTTEQEVLDIVKSVLPQANIQMGKCKQCEQERDVRPFGPDHTDICVECAAKPQFRDTAVQYLKEFAAKQVEQEANDFPDEVVEEVLLRHATMKNVPIQ